MGAMFQGKCFSSATEAVDAYFSSIGPRIDASTTPPTVFHFERSYPESGLDGWMVCSSPADWSFSVECSPVFPPVFPTCEPSSGFSDGVVIGWGIALVMAIAWGWRLMQRAAT